MALNGDFVMKVELEEARNKTVPIKVCFYVATIQKQSSSLWVVTVFHLSYAQINSLVVKSKTLNFLLFLFEFPFPSLHSIHMIFLSEISELLWLQTPLQFLPVTCQIVKKSHMLIFPRPGNLFFVLTSCQRTRGVLHGSDSSAGVRVPGSDAGSSLRFSGDESQPSWIKGAEKCGWLIKANQQAFLCA